VEKPYHVVEKKDTQGWANFLAKNGQTLLPMLEFIEQSQVAVDDFIDVMGRAMIEALLRLSAEGVAGPPHPGKKGGAIGWHGGEQGTICLRERKLRVKRPRLRKKGEKKEGEVPVPAYEAMRADGKLGSRMLEILLRGVSTRQYAKVLPEMAETVGVSRSSVSREAIQASEAELKRLCERRLDDLELLVLYVDGVIFGEHHVLGAVGVDAEGCKHVLALAEGASENQVVATGSVGRPGATRGEAGSEVPVCDRRLESLAGGDRRGVRHREPGAKVPPSQARERQRILAGGAEGPGEGGDAGRLSAAGEGRDGQAGEASAVAGARIPECRRQLARRLGGDVHRESPGAVGQSGALLVLD